MTVINPNSVAGINSITVQSGNSLSVHKSNGELIRTITSNSGVSTFSSISVGTATTDNSAAKSINIGLGASISQHDDNTLTFGTNGDPQVVLGATGHLVFPNNGKGVVFGATSGSNRPSITGSYTSSSNNHLLFNVTGEERARIDSSGRVLIGHDSSLAIGGGDNAPLQTSATSSVVFGGVRYTNASGGPFLSLSKSRAAAAGSNTIVQDDDELGTILFSGDDGTDLISKGAQIQAAVDGTPGSNDMPGRLVFSTTADGAVSPTERLRIDSSGRVMIGGGTYIGGAALAVLGTGNTPNTYGSFAIARVGANVTANTTISNIRLNGGTLGTGRGAEINAAADANWSDGSSHPTRLTFHTVASSSTSASERLRITSAGKILMGGTDAYANFENSSTNPRLQVRGTDLNGSCQAWIRATADAGAPKLFLANTRNTSGNGHTVVQSGDELGGIFFAGSDGSQFVNGAAIVANVDDTPGADDMPGRLDIQTTPNGSTTLATHMRFEENGDIRIGNYGTLFGNTGITLFGSSLSGGPQFQISRENANPILLNRNGTDGDIVEFRKGWGAGGTIDIATNSVTYNTSSDYRLKENIVAITDGITRLKTLKPSRFNWIGDTSSTRDGFIAHEVTAVPEAISGTKDETYTEDDSSRNIKAGDPKYQGIDQSKLVPLLTAALQEAITKIETLETKVAALEGG